MYMYNIKSTGECDSPVAPQRTSGLASNPGARSPFNNSKCIRDKQWCPGEVGYSLKWPIQGGSATQGYRFSGFRYIHHVKG